MQEFHKTESGVRDTVMVSMPDEKLEMAFRDMESDVSDPSSVWEARFGCSGCPGEGGETATPGLQAGNTGISKQDHGPSFKDASAARGEFPSRLHLFP